MVYDPALGSVRDTIRFALADTSDTAPLCPDQTYDALLAVYADWEAAAQAATFIAGTFAQKIVSFGESGGINVGWMAGRVQFYEERAIWLRSYQSLNGLLSSASGTITTATVKSSDPYKPLNVAGEFG